MKNNESLAIIAVQKSELNFKLIEYARRTIREA